MIFDLAGGQAFAKLRQRLDRQEGMVGKAVMEQACLLRIKRRHPLERFGRECGAVDRPVRGHVGPSTSFAAAAAPSQRRHTRSALPGTATRSRSSTEENTSADQSLMRS